MKRKAFRRQIKEQDEFLSTSEQVLLYVRENPARAGFYLGAVILLLVAVWGAGRFVDYRRTKILNLEGEASLLYQAAQEDKTKIPEALTKLTGAYERFPGSLAGQVSLYHAASLNFSQGNYQKAAEQYRLLTDKHPDNKLLYPLAMKNLAYTAEAMGNYQLARDTVANLLKTDSSLPKDQLRLDLARILGGLGDEAQAKSLWQEIINSSPDSAYAAAAREKLGLPPEKPKEKK